MHTHDFQVDRWLIELRMKLAASPEAHHPVLPPTNIGRSTMALLRSAVVALSLCAGASGFLLAPPTAGNANNRSPVLRHGTTTAAVRVCVVVWGGVGSAGLAWDRRASAPRDPDRVLPGPRPAPKSTDFLPPISDPKLNEQRTQTAAAPALRRHTHTNHH